jgi:hypothetical protein
LYPPKAYFWPDTPVGPQKFRCFKKKIFFVFNTEKFPICRRPPGNSEFTQRIQEELFFLGANCKFIRVPIRPPPTAKHLIRLDQNHKRSWSPSTRLNFYKKKRKEIIMHQPKANKMVPQGQVSPSLVLCM